MKHRHLLLFAVLPAFACSSAEFRPRAVGTLNAGVLEVDELMAEARLHAESHNFALAVTSYRRVLRQAPNHVEAYRGMAAAYDRLGRFDLARRYYEEGLALAPEDPALRIDYAATLRAHGMEREAALVDLPAVVEQAEAAAPAESVAGGASLAILLPPGPAPVATESASVEIVLPPAPAPTPVAAASVEIVLPLPAPAPARAPAPTPAQVSRVAPDVVPPRPAPVAARPVRASVDIVLPPLAPAPARTAGASAAVALPPPAPAIERVPRLERHSLGVVALITRRDPARRQQMAAATPREGIRLPIRQIRSTGREIVWELPAVPTPPPAAPQSARRLAIVELRVLNAVGRRGQAGRMGTHLRDLGWAEVSAGDAIRRRSRSYFLASPTQAAAARRLAAQLPFRPWINMTGRSGPIRLVLGHDAVRFDERLLRGRRSS